MSSQGSAAAAKSAAPEEAVPSGGAAAAGAEPATESPLSSCVSSDEEEAAMVLVGCPKCLMYVMLYESNEQPRCPRCKSPVLVHFVRSSAAGTGAAEAANAGES